jgi:hypothetical protein
MSDKASRISSFERSAKIPPPAAPERTSGSLPAMFIEQLNTGMLETARARSDTLKLAPERMMLVLPFSDFLASPLCTELFVCGALSVAATKNPVVRRTTDAAVQTPNLCHATGLMLKRLDPSDAGP